MAGDMKTTFPILILLLFFYSCAVDTNSDDVGFQSLWTFEPTLHRNWAGPDYWLNPLQAWEQKKGKLNVIASGGDRNCVLLTRELNEDGDEFTMVVDIENLTNDDDDGWAGFQIGLRGQFNDYRDDAVHGKGFCAGVKTNGRLFIGTVNNGSPKVKWNNRFKLKFTGKRQTDTSFLTSLIYLNNYDTKNDTLQIVVHSSWLSGLVALTCSNAFPSNQNIADPPVRIFQKSKD